MEDKLCRNIDAKVFTSNLLKNGYTLLKTYSNEEDYRNFFSISRMGQDGGPFEREISKGRYDSEDEYMGDGLFAGLQWYRHTFPWMPKLIDNMDISFSVWVGPIIDSTSTYPSSRNNFWYKYDKNLIYVANTVSSNVVLEYHIKKITTTPDYEFKHPDLFTHDIADRLFFDMIRRYGYELKKVNYRDADARVAEWVEGKRNDINFFMTYGEYGNYEKYFSILFGNDDERCVYMDCERVGSRVKILSFSYYNNVEKLKCLNDVEREYPN